MLHFTGEFPPYFSGGLATYVSAVTSRLAEAHEVDVVLLKGDEEQYQDVSSPNTDVSLTVSEFDPERLQRFEGTWIDPTEASEMITEVSADAYDVVHVHDWYGVFGALAATAGTDVPIVVSSHLPLRSGFTYSGHPVSRRTKLKTEALGFRIADRVLAPSRFVARVLRREYEVARERIEVVPNGVDTSGYVPDDRTPSEPADVVRVVTVGRLTEQKGIPYLLDAVATLPDDVDVEVTVVGAGPRRESLETSCAELGLADVVTFTGFVPGAELRAAYREAHLFAFPSIYEPFGLVVLEAMASGLPVVAFDAGGVREIVRDGTDGHLVTPGDAGAFGSALTELAGDDEQRAEMSRRARERAETFDWERTVTGLETIYDAAVSGEHA